MATLIQHTVETLRGLREKLLDIKKDKLSYHALEQCVVQNRDGLDMAHSVGVPLLYNVVIKFIAGHENNTNVDVLDDIRHRIVELIDGAITKIDSQEIVRPVLDDLILRVKDMKLSTMLKEFNATKDSQPNFAAVGFRTILCLIIQEKAKLVCPSGKLANSQDLALEPAIKSAIDDKIFKEGEARLIKRFLTGGQKDIFDNIAHKPGGNALVRKENLSDAVETLNKLLPTIC